ncbi:MAG: Sulfate and thiosulfate binding protein CysP [Hydrogenibacillus schlegelii]|uniref:Sulfate and thiosulfate binding protein CysP n=2 Tax=Hydrogenibacillus schlegelii TaxID=1484 RepID=A0A2T5GBR3_HYDSH|nr:MAG: Sulfate and thiosulfate binding protein CysP [Hydrogenibacillus schlegelii]
MNMRTWIKRRGFAFFILIIAVAFAGLAACSNASGTGEKGRGDRLPTQEEISASGRAADGRQGDAPAVEILNVSFDVGRELYADYNQAFAAYWKRQTGRTVTIHQSHGAASKQARAVIDGLKADVVTLNVAYDIDAIAAAGLIDKHWQSRLPHHSAPYTTTAVFLVRAGNPKGIKDWDDLVKPGVEVITPNPKTAGAAKWFYLAAWGYALQKYNGDEEKAKAFVAELYRHVPVLDTGQRGSTTTFVERGIGDVFIAFENEASFVLQEFGKDRFEIVAPSKSILVEFPVSVVDKVVDEKGTRDVAEAYLEYLYSEEGQAIAAKHFYRPRLEAVAKRYADQYLQVQTFTVEELGGWQKVHDLHFADGGLFDQIFNRGR